MKPLNLRRSESGQAIVEYLLMVMVALSVAATLAFGFRKAFFRMWMQMACEITAPCPHCQAPPEIRGSANKVAPGTCR